jgi:SAM-dependent methyltransferase
MPGAETFNASADAYDGLVGRYSHALACELVDFAGLEPGDRALDVGCGPGALTALLADRLGAHRVNAVDPSVPFVEACRRRRSGVEVSVATAEHLPFADDMFDIALSQLVVNFMDDAPAGAREMTRVTRTGGTVAACVWDYAGEMRLLRAFWDAARATAPRGAAVADEATVMGWCAEGDLHRLWLSVGLVEVRSAPLVVSATYTDIDDLWSPFTAGVGPAGAFCSALDAERRAALRHAFLERLDVGAGPFALSARAWAVAGTVGTGVPPGVPRRFLA